ncbi:MAG: hypothetical protein WCR59_10845 [Planctomycetota bacterium]
MHGTAMQAKVAKSNAVSRRTKVVLRGFDRLRIPPKIDKHKIISAFRVAAKQVHPDPFQSVAEKGRAHGLFIALASARDA